VSAALIVAAFGFALPRFASYHSVWASLQAMPWPYALLTLGPADRFGYFIYSLGLLGWLALTRKGRP